ncbi:MAG: malate synthase A [Candidatus Sericytochromatia bacterium]|nr:malate synthase A [Candidatus Sericytochromatia bacterium]
MEILPKPAPADAAVLTQEALAFVADLARRFEGRRQALLAARQVRAGEIRGGRKPDFLAETAQIRTGDWHVAGCPADLLDRRTEITGPTDRKMIINALNSGAKVFMADCEDSLSPTWRNAIDGQQHLMDAVRRTIGFTSPEGKRYDLQAQTATLVVRPRGWHLSEKHVLLDGTPISASLFDFGLYFFHNAAELLARGSGPYFYLPKLESHLEARLWNDVFGHAQTSLGIPAGAIRATVLIETILAAFEMDEILYELRDHAAGLNAGRWDYMFSVIKKFHDDPAFVLPERAQLTMTVPFMRAYTELLVQTCHKRGAHAIGGMSAFVPNRKDPAVNETAFANVRADKQREATDGFDGTWVAHPDLVPVAKAVFDAVLGDRPNQKDRQRPDVRASAAALLDPRVAGGTISVEGLRNNVSVALQYLAAWLQGTGAVTIANLMEDAATAEISRAQLWQWRVHGARLTDGRSVTADLYREVRATEVTRLEGETGQSLQAAAGLLDDLVLSDQFAEFLTGPAYQVLAG